MPKSTRKHLTVREKLEVITYFKSKKCSVRKLALHFNIGKTQAGDIVRNEDKLIELWQSNSDTERKCLNPDSISYQIDKSVYKWYTQMKNSGIPVTGSMIQSTALGVAKELGHTDFKASSGWLGRFQKRHRIVLRATANDDKITYDTFEEWRTVLASVMSDYSPEDIFCAGETGLFFQAVPKDIPDLKHETCSDGKLANQRLTILLCVNMAGKKEKPLIISNILKDKSIGASDTDFQVECESNVMAWMNRSIMTKWLNELDLKLSDQNKKITLFLSKTSSHFQPHFQNIKIVYFPTHLLELFQPINQGIIQMFKIYYRQLLLRHLISTKINESESLETITLTQAISWIKSAWDVMPELFIQKCFKKVGFEFFTPEVNEPISHILNVFEEPSFNDIPELLAIYDSKVNAATYIDVDANLATEGPDAELIEVSVDNQILDIYDESNEQTTSDETQRISSIKSYSDAIKCLKEVGQFYWSQNDIASVSLISELIAHHENIIKCAETEQKPPA